MIRGLTGLLFVLSFTIIFLASCVSSSDAEEDVTSRVAVEEVEEPVVDKQPEPTPEPEPEPEPEPVEENTNEKDPEPEPAEEPEETPEEEFAVSEQVFTETFEDVRRLIDQLNSIVRAENYDRWLDYLTDEYIDHFSSPEVLEENSEQPLLKKYDIKLNSLRDYFKYVVVPSRSNARLDDLVFVDNEHVKAIMIIKNNRTILYLLEKDESGWKIGL